MRSSPSHLFIDSVTCYHLQLPQLWHSQCTDVSIKPERRENSPQKISSLRSNKSYGDAMKLLAAQQVKLGFIGLGNMGSRIALRLLARGYELTVFDRDNTKAGALVLNGAVLANNIVELRDVIETIPTFAWTALPDGSVDFVNRHWQEYTGLSAERTVGSGWQAAVHAADLKRHAEKWRVSLATGEPFESEVRYRRAADGQYRWFLSRGVPLRSPGGNILKWYGISTDIEDRKRAEGALRSSE